MILIMRKIYLKLIILFYVLCCNTSILFAQKDIEQEKIGCYCNTVEVEKSCHRCGGKLKSAVIKGKKKCPNCKGSGTVKSYDNGRSVRVKCTVEHNGYDASVGGYFIYEYKSGLKCENCGEEYSR